MTTPTDTAGKLIAFESARDLIAPLQETRHLLDALAIKEAAITGLRDRIEHLRDLIAGVPAESSRAAIYQGALGAAERQLECVRAWTEVTGPLPRADINT